MFHFLPDIQTVWLDSVVSWMLPDWESWLHSSLLKAWDPPLLLGDAVGGKPCSYTEGVNTLCLYSHVPLSPFDETVPSLMQWDASPDRGRKRPCICSPWLGSGVLVTHKKSHVGCVSKADASSLCPKSELEWEPSGMCGLSGEAWSVYLLFDHRAVHSVFYIVFLRLR